MSRVVDIAAQFNGRESDVDSDRENEHYTPGIINNASI